MHFFELLFAFMLMIRVAAQLTTFICVALLLAGLTLNKRLDRIGKFHGLELDVSIPFVPQSAAQFGIVALLGFLCWIVAKMAKDFERYK
ncbi:MAG: hypothetical protein Q4A98_00800 [Comamonadaceae bacterium]|nr:hypothetical protein [Comamonadaceae bacterium]